MLVELYVKANRVEEALTAAKRGITVCKELGDVASQASARASDAVRLDMFLENACFLPTRQQRRGHPPS